MKLQKVQVSDLGEIITGNTPPKVNSEYYGTHTIFVKPTDINVNEKYTYTTEESYSDLAYKKYIKSLIPKGSTCVVTIGSIGKKITKAHCDLFINQAMNAIVPNKNYDEDFIFYLLKFNLAKVKMVDSGTASGRENVSKSAFSKINLNVPSLNIQKKIGKLLSNYDDLIENNNKRIKLLENMAEELYKEWFVRLRFPNYQNTKIEDGIPQGWEEKRVLEFGKVIIGKTPLTSKEEYYNGDVPFIKTPDFRQGIYIVNTEETLSKTGASLQKNQFVPENSICISCIGTVGEVVLTTKKSQTNQQINTIILNDLNYLEYLYFSLKNLKPLIQAYASTGATMGNLSKGKFEQIKILSPNEDLVISYSKLIKPMFKEIKKLMLKNQTLKQTRDLLLPRLLSGKLDIEKLDIN